MSKDLVALVLINSTGDVEKVFFIPETIGSVSEIDTLVSRLALPDTVENFRKTKIWRVPVTLVSSLDELQIAIETNKDRSEVWLPEKS